MTRNAPLVLVLLVVLIVSVLILADRNFPEPEDTPIITTERTSGGLVKTDVVLMQRYKGKLRLAVETDLDVYISKGELLPNKNPNFCANLMRLVDDHAYIGSTASKTENGAMLQVLCQKEKLTEGAIEKVPADRPPDKPKKGDICAAFMDQELLSGRAVYFCLKESDTLKSNYQVVGHLSEGLEKLVALDNGARIQSLQVERLVPGLEGKL